MNIDYFTEVISSIIEISGLTAVVFFLFMLSFLMANGIHPVFKVYHEDFFLKAIFKFRDYSKKSNSKFILVYYLFLLCIFILLTSILFEFFVTISEAPVPIIITAILAAIFILPAIAIIVIIWSKETYY